MKIKIGLEIHVQLTVLKSKLFCYCPADYRGREPNINICPICIGLPGTLPLLNKEALKYALMLALALNCNISDNIIFYRKNYFYPDLPKNFQITQYNTYGISSVGYNGKSIINERVIRIRRIQLEEDPGRLIYENRNAYIDYNRAGISLVEIVTEPDFDDPKVVRDFLNRLSNILTHLGIDPELEGVIRCDLNVSIGDGNRVEIKNVNSFKDVEKALLFEISRQKSLALKDIKIEAETRHWDDARKITISARSKEEEEDYRYFPEADIPVIPISKEMINSIKESMPELPDEKLIRFINLGINESIAMILIEDKVIESIFEDALNYYNNYKEIANWIVSDLKGYLSRSENIKISGRHIAELAMMVDNGIITRTLAKQVLIEMVKSGELPTLIVKKMNLETNNLNEIIEAVLKEDPKAVKDALINEKAINFLLGKVMQYTKGKADPKLALELIRNKIKE